jgi:hypothetical protein
MRSSGDGTVTSSTLWVPNWSSISCDLGIFVDQPAEPIATSEAKAGLDRRRRQWSKWCCVLQGAVGTVLVEMRRVLGQYVFEVVPVEDQYSVEQLAADGADPAFGDRVRSRRLHQCAQDADAFAGEHGIEDVGELAVVILDQELESGHALAEVHQQIPRLLSNPGSARIGRDSQKMHAAAGVLHEEQDIQPLTQQRVDAEKVGGDNALCLDGQKLSPGRVIAARCGVDAGSREDRPHRARRHWVAKPREFAVDAPVTPGGVLRGQPQHQPAQSGAVRRPAVRRRDWVQRCLTRSWCHRKIVAGVTIRGSWQARDNSRVSVGEHRLIRPRQPRSPDLATEHGNLMTEHQDIHILSFDLELRASSPSRATSCPKMR